MSKVAVVTDSTAYISPELAKDLPVRFVPLQVIWGEKTFRDNVDISPDEFYTRLKSDKVTPTTSQPSPGSFQLVYQELLEAGYEILSVHISGKLSGTLDSAAQARATFPGARIELVDSNTTSLAMGFPVLAAVRAAQQGASLQDCKALAEKGCQNTGILFAVNTLEFLRRGGRIGGAQAFLGTALNLKPILEVRGGRIEAVERVRTMSKALDRLIDLFEERIGSRRPLHIGVVHAQAEAEACLLLERVTTHFGSDLISETQMAPVSPVLGTHVGPGTMGLAFMAGL
jgi:DegV family protein with EDD domain